LTKYNRVMRGLEKTHWLDAANVGRSTPASLIIKDIVRAVVTSGTKQGTSVGKVAVRTRGVFNITTVQGVVTDIHRRFCVLIARSDGYTYQQCKEAALPPTA